MRAAQAPNQGRPVTSVVQSAAPLASRLRRALPWRLLHTQTRFRPASEPRAYGEIRIAHVYSESGPLEAYGSRARPAS